VIFWRQGGVYPERRLKFCLVSERWGEAFQQEEVEVVCRKMGDSLQELSSWGERTPDADQWGPELNGDQRVKAGTLMTSCSQSQYFVQHGFYCAWILRLLQRLIGKSLVPSWWCCQELVGPRGRKLGNWGHALEGAVETQFHHFPTPWLSPFSLPQAPSTCHRPQSNQAN
jgi:hypothetical protein